MRKLYYVKEGRKYVPVAEYDSDLLDSFHKGVHIIMTYPGGQTIRYDIDPNYATMIAAGRVAEDAMCRAISKAAELRPPKTPITPKQKKAWEALAKEFGDEICTLQGLSAHDIAEAGIKAMMEEADNMMSNPAVRKAYEDFMLLVKLTQEK